MTDDTTAAPGTHPDEQDGGDIAETIMARSYEKGFNDGIKQNPTLRDQFAMAALTGYCLRPYDAKTEGGMGGLFMARAQLAYDHADAMLAVRNRKTDHG